MELGALILLLLVTVPVIGGALCFGLRAIKTLRIGVMASAISTISLGLLLFAYMTWNGQTIISVDASGIAPVGLLMTLLHFALLAVFFLIGYKERSWVVILFGVAQLIPTLWFESTALGLDPEPAMIADFLSVTMVLITSIIGSIICIYAIKYMEHDSNQPRFFALMFIFLGAMNGAVFSNNLMWFLVFWEITTICSYLLIRHEMTVEAKRSGLRALIYTFGGGVALVSGIILLEHYTGTILLSQIPGGGALAGLALLPVALMAIAAFTKSAQVPFQNWLLGAMVAPTPVSALLHSATLVNLGVYLLMRLSPAISQDPGLSWGVALVGGLSFLSTAILAIAQSSSKRVLAYSSIGTLGLIVLCAAIGTKEALFAGLVLLLFHAISKALLFMSVGVVKHETGNEDIEPMDGLRDRMPFVAFALLIGVLTVLNPPFGVFASKWMISEVVVSYPLLAFVLAVGFGASVVFYGKWLGRAFTPVPDVGSKTERRPYLSPIFKWTLGALMVGAVGLSVLMSQVVSYLIIPYVGPLPNDPFFVSSSFGSFPLFLLLTVVVLVLAALALRPRPDRAKTFDAYTGGEPFRFQMAGAYFFGGEQERKAILAFDLLGASLLVALVILPLLQEVGVWTP